MSTKPEVIHVSKDPTKPNKVNVVDVLPTNLWRGRDGRFTLESEVKEYEKLREAVLAPLFERFMSLHAEMADLKAQMMDDVENLLALCADQYGVKPRGSKGNLTLYRYDGEFMLKRQIQDRSRFSERLFAAEELVKQCLEEWSVDARSELKTIFMAAFERNKEGDIRRSELIRLRGLKIDDPRWNKAMGIIAEAEEIIESASYFQVHKRMPTGEYQSVLLDFSAIQPQYKPKAEA